MTEWLLKNPTADESKREAIRRAKFLCDFELAAQAHAAARRAGELAQHEVRPRLQLLIDRLAETEAFEMPLGFVVSLVPGRAPEPSVGARLREIQERAGAVLAQVERLGREVDGLAGAIAQLSHSFGGARPRRSRGRPPEKNRNAALQVLRNAGFSAAESGRLCGMTADQREVLRTRVRNRTRSK
jgi:hypothetical protein